MTKDNNGIIRVLHIVPNMNAGGLETFIMNLYRNIDRSKIQFDFLVHYQERCHYDDEIEALGGYIYRFSLRNDNNIFKYIKRLNTFYKEHTEYKIIHCHMASIGFINFLVAKKNGIKIRIAHSHNISCEKTIKGLVKRIMMIPYKYVSTINFACSTEAGKYLFGKKKFEVIPNAIDLEKFKFNKEKRTIIRKELGVDDNTIVIGHIGRFNLQKNHKKVVEVFKSYHNLNNNSILVLVGIGSEENYIRKLVSENNLDDVVHFLGVRKDTDYLYSGFDAFLFPSLFEGLGIVLIEAQCSGLYCYTSKQRVPDSAIIGDRLDFIKLDKSNNYWANSINSKNLFDRKNVKFTKNKNNYDVKKVSLKLEKFYKEVI